MKRGGDTKAREIINIQEATVSTASLGIGKTQTVKPKKWDKSPPTNLDCMT
jgi:hypothetical protein